MDTARLRTLALSLAVLAGASAPALPQPAQAPTLVWEENFDGPGIDGANWTHDLGTGCRVGICGWGNDELQYYTGRPENARIEDGRLVIEAHRERFRGSAFTSARLKTEGRMHFRYGTVEARIRIPEVGNGLWPAFWMLGTIGVWPARGEIDIMEAGLAAAIEAGIANRRIGAAVHWEHEGAHASHEQEHVAPVDLHRDFHVYRMEWDPAFIRMSIDGQPYFEFDIAGAEGRPLHAFHHPHFLLLNLAVGGTYPGIDSPDDVTAPPPWRMEVDYVRLYQDHPDSELDLGGAGATAGP